MKTNTYPPFYKVFFKGVLPLFFWMALIFTLSSRERVALTENYVVSFAVFKTAHLIEYGILYSLWLRLLTMMQIKRSYLWAFIATMGYAVSDEWHQTLIPTREGRIRDILIDLLGAGVVWWALASYKKLRHKLINI